jgi:hypothetical protein
MNPIQAFAQTTWENPTNDTVQFSIYDDAANLYTVGPIPPKGSVTLPSVYDNAIATVRDGVIVGGLAPQLVAKGRERVPMHDALARAAAMGEQERKLILATGVSAGGLSLDAVAGLHARIAELEAAKTSTQAAVTAAVAPHAEPPPPPPAKPANK